MEAFFTKIKGYCDELDSIDSIPTCSCSACSCNLNQKVYKRQQDRRLIQFLMKDDLPDLPTPTQAYRMMKQEQKH